MNRETNPMKVCYGITPYTSEERSKLFFATEARFTLPENLTQVEFFTSEIALTDAINTARRLAKKYRWTWWVPRAGTKFGEPAVIWRFNYQRYDGWKSDDEQLAGFVGGRVVPKEGEGMQPVRISPTFRYDHPSNRRQGDRK